MIFMQGSGFFPAGGHVQTPYHHKCSIRIVALKVIQNQILTKLGMKKIRDTSCKYDKRPVLLAYILLALLHTLELTVLQKIACISTS